MTGLNLWQTLSHFILTTPYKLGIIVIILLYGGGQWGTERLNTLPKFTWLEGSAKSTLKWSDPTLLACNHNYTARN
jgi:hypothetical protein